VPYSNDEYTSQNKEPSWAHVLCIGDSQLKEYNGYQEYATLTGHAGGSVSVAFSPGGPPIIVSGSDDNTIKVWDGTTHAPLATLTRWLGAVRSVLSRWTPVRVAFRAEAFPTSGALIPAALPGEPTWWALRTLGLLQKS